MSYARFVDWDVYVFETDGGVQCNNCALSDRHFLSDVAADIAAHMAAHAAAGHRVPSDLLDPATYEPRH